MSTPSAGKRPRDDEAQQDFGIAEHVHNAKKHQTNHDPKNTEPENAIPPHLRFDPSEHPMNMMYRFLWL